MNRFGDASWPEDGERICGYLRGLSEGTIRIVAGLLLTVGLALCALALFADQLGIGGSPGFGWKQFAVLIVSGLAIAVGGLLLARPQIVAPTVTIPPLTFGKAALISLGALLLVDWHLILAHVWVTWGGTPPSWAQGWELSLMVDGGLGEKVMYIKLSIAAGLLTAIAVRYKAAVLAAWALTLVVIVADDALLIHERGGDALASDLQAAFGLRDQDLGEDLGELLVWAGLAAIVLPLLALTHRISDRPARAISWRLAALLGALVFFGVVVDMLHVAFQESAGFALVEDGGELLVSTLFLVLIIAATSSEARGSDLARDP